jgi:RNA polymerase sigma factor (TIGR02999 family)
MASNVGSDVTQILSEIGKGDRRAADRLLEVVYEELHRLAESRLAREQGNPTIQATALVHEAYLRLLGNDDGYWRDRGHFFGAAAEAMRRILVEQARRRSAAIRGGDRKRVELHESAIVLDDDSTDLVALSDALDRLQREDADKALLVKLRYFTGLTIAQAASAMEISHATAERYWTYSRLRLFQWMKEDSS